MKEEEKIPIGVWVFWAFAGFTLLGFLASRYTTLGKALTATISVVGSLGALIAGIATYLTVRELRNERKEERFNRRPRFSISEIYLGAMTEEGFQDLITVTYKQIGVNPAALVTLTISGVSISGYGALNPTTKVHRHANEINFQEQFTETFPGPWLVDPNAEHYIEVEITYIDAVYGTNYPAQKFYFDLGEVKSDEIQQPLRPARREMIQQIRNVLND